MLRLLFFVFVWRGGGRVDNLIGLQLSEKPVGGVSIGIFQLIQSKNQQKKQPKYGTVAILPRFTVIEFIFLEFTRRFFSQIHSLRTNTIRKKPPMNINSM